jgi:hypothetical protein
VNLGLDKTLPQTKPNPTNTDEFHSAITKTTEEALHLIESGFEFVCEYNGQMPFRKRK